MCVCVWQQGVEGRGDMGRINSAGASHLRTCVCARCVCEVCALCVI